MKNLLQASEDSTGDKRTPEGRNTSASDDSIVGKEKQDGLKANESISDKTVMRELLSSVKEKIGSEILSATAENNFGQIDRVTTSYR